MENFKNLALLIVVLIFTFACQPDDPEFGNIVAPTNIEVFAEIVGQDDANPNGDGSGVVNFSVTADNASAYRFVFGSNEQTSSSGNASFIFSNLGVNTYTVNVIAYGTAGSSSSTSITVDVLATYSPPTDLITKLYGFDPANPDADTSRTWRIKNDQAGHFGLGPVGGQIPTEWYGAGVNEKAGVGMYDDRYIFNSNGTFEFITNINSGDSTGTVFGRAGQIDQLGGSGGTVNGADVENLPYEDFQVAYSLIAPGGTETISFSGNGFIGYFTGGTQNYEIFDRSVPGELILKTTDGNNEFDWWFILTSEE